MIEITNDLSDYEKIVNKGELPVYAKNRSDIRYICEEANKYYSRNFNVKKISKALILSEVYQLISLINKITENIISLDELYAINSDEILVILIYEDFKSNIFKHIQKHCIKKNIQLYVLLGRDLASLSWNLAKQFLKPIENYSSAFLSTKKLSPLKKKKLKNCSVNQLEVYNEEDMTEDNLIENFSEKKYNNIAIYAHGIEDNITFSDSIFCGKNDYVRSKSCNYGPHCHYYNNCFKTNVLNVRRIKCQNLFLISCNNSPFSDMNAYDSKYNLLLNAIDGFPKYILGSVMNHRIDVEYLYNGLLNNEKLEKLLNKVTIADQSCPAFLNFGIPFDKTNDVNISYDRGSSNLSANVSDAFNSVTNILNIFDIQDKKLENKLLKFKKEAIKYFSLIKRMDFEEAKITNQTFSSRINGLNYDFSDYLFKNSNDKILAFDSVFSKFPSKNTELNHVTCNCGNDAIEFIKTPSLKNFLKTKDVTCYKCGNKKSLIENSVDFNLSKLNEVTPGNPIECTIHIISSSSKIVYFSYFLPGYIAKKIERKNHKLKLNIGKNIFKIKIPTSADIEKQQYYLTLYIIDNLQISKITENFYVI